MGGRCAAAAELSHGLLTEWWTSGPDGVWQGWTLHEPLGAWFVGTAGGYWRYDDLLA